MRRPRLLGPAPPGGPAADRRLAHRRPAARAGPVPPAVGDDLARVDAPEGDRPPGRRPQTRAGRSSSPRSSSPAARAGPPARHSASSARRLPTPASDGLVHDARLDRHHAAADARAEPGPAELGGVGADAGEVRLQADPAQSPLVAEHEPAAVGEVQREAVPAPGRGPRIAARSSTTMRPAIPRCRPSIRPRRRSRSTWLFPRRWALGEPRPARAAAISPGRVRPADPGVARRRRRRSGGRSALRLHQGAGALDLGELRHLAPGAGVASGPRRSS